MEAVDASLDLTEGDALDLAAVAQRAYSVAYRILGNPADAEDVGQEVLVRVLKHQRRLESSRNPAGWVYRVAVNCATDVLRRRQRQGRMPQEAGATDNSAAAGLDLKTLLAALTPRERAATALVFGEGLTCVEAAKVLRCLPNTVRVLCHRARKKIRKSYASEKS